MKKNNKCFNACATSTLMRMRLALAIALVGMVVSCNMQDLEPTKEEIEGEKMTMTAERDDSPSVDTRTSIDGLTFTWTDSDKLGVYLKDATESIVFDYVSGAGSNSAAFSGALAPSAEYVYAAYPEDATFATEGGNVKAIFTLPTVQTQKHFGEGVTGLINPIGTGDYAYMYGKSTNNVSAGDNIPMEMEQLMTIFDFDLASIPKDVQVKSLSVTTSTAGFTQTATVNLDDNTITSSGTEKTITVNTERNLTPVSGEFTFRLLMFPETVTQNTEWTIKLKTGDGEYPHVRTFSAEKVYAKGMRYTVPLQYNNFSGAPIPILPPEEITDLSVYPRVTVVGGFEIYVYDRNAGINVPRTAEVKIAENWINGDNKADLTDGIGNFAFKGDHYTWQQAQDGKNSDGSAMCPLGWRVPTMAELQDIGEQYTGNITVTDGAAILLGDNGKSCFFPKSGFLPANSHFTTGSYWSSTAVDDVYAHRLGIFPTFSSMRTDSRSKGLSVRCVKPVEVEVITDLSVYPMVTVSGFEIYVYDRNAGINVPKTADVTIAENWINGDNHLDLTDGIGNFAFKGDYYSWDEAMAGNNSDGSAMCPLGWRVPNEAELTKISENITLDKKAATFLGTNNKKCFFPISATVSMPHAPFGSYWSSTANGAKNAYRLGIFPTSSRVLDNEPKTNGLAVRCVKDVN